MAKLDVGGRDALVLLAAVVGCACAVALVGAQFTKYRMPKEPGYVPCYVPPNMTQRSYCPPGTRCVDSLLAAGIWGGGMADADLQYSNIPAPGCCPLEAPTPCFSTGLSGPSVPGCCPQNYTCCMDAQDSSHMVGCARSLTQCCGSVICPEGYSCCDTTSAGGAYCCPGAQACLGFGPPLPNTTLAPGARAGAFVPNTYPAGAVNSLALREYTECMYVNASTRAVRPWAPDEAFACGTAGSWCRNGTLTGGAPDVCVDGAGVPIDPANATRLAQDGRFCCRANTTACRRNPAATSQEIVGCADEAAGETCCATQVCGLGSKCCSVPSPPWWDTSAERGLLAFGNRLRASADICCPAGTFCCATVVNAAGMAQGQFEVVPYCGRNANCTSLATVSEAVQPTASLQGFYPGYIEGAGWLDRDAVALAVTPPGAQGECNTCRAACNCRRGDPSPGSTQGGAINSPPCADQCELNPVTIASGEADDLDRWCGYLGSDQEPSTYAALEQFIGCGCQGLSAADPGFPLCKEDDDDEANTGFNMMPPCVGQVD